MICRGDDAIRIDGVAPLVEVLNNMDLHSLVEHHSLRDHELSQVYP